MQTIRGNEWEASEQIYTPNQIESILKQCHVDIASEVVTHFYCYCPFHHNVDTPAMAIDKQRGLFICFNPSCGQSGNLVDLIRKTTDKNEFQIQRMIYLARSNDMMDFADHIAELLKPPTLPTFSKDVLNKMYEDFWKSNMAQEYMHGRGFSDETLEYFRVGYSARKNMIAVPMHDIDGVPVGVIGRTPSSVDKRFKNSKNLPKGKIAWNIHRAKRAGSAVIICESSYDAMRVHQAGFPNVVALLGPLSHDQATQIGRYFDSITIFTDMDALKRPPNCKKCKGDCKGHREGRDLGRKIVDAFQTKRIYWACYSNEEITPGWVKDASDMTDEEIRQCIFNRKTHFEYITSGLEALAPV